MTTDNMTNTNPTDVAVKAKPVLAKTKPVLDLIMHAFQNLPSKHEKTRYVQAVKAVLKEMNAILNPQPQRPVDADADVGNNADVTAG